MRATEASARGRVPWRRCGCLVRDGCVVSGSGHGRCDGEAAHSPQLLAVVDLALMPTLSATSRVGVLGGRCEQCPGWVLHVGVVQGCPVGEGRAV